MGRSISRLFYSGTVWCIFFIIYGCKNKDSETILINPKQYVAHIQLDSTTLVATEVISGLSIPWEITVGPDGNIWLTEQSGIVSILDPETGDRSILLEIKDVYFRKSYGLLSMDLDPDFDTKPYIYLHYTFTYHTPEQKRIIKSRVARYTYDKDTLINPVIILDSIPGRTFHNGSRMKFAPDGKLLLNTGDAGHQDLAQDISYLGGKMLRMNPDGSVPEDNPFPGSYVWSFGHRNAQGLTFGPGDKIYTSEHGPAMDDEINLIKKGANYGWPDVEGACDLPAEEAYCTAHSVHEPLFTWSPTIAVAGMEYYDHTAIPEWRNSLLLGTLKAQSLRVLNLSGNGDKITDQEIYFQQYLGRIRDIAVAPDGVIYLSTSNMDWHYKRHTWMYDSLPLGKKDRIIKLQPATASVTDQLASVDQKKVLTEEEEVEDIPLHTNDVPGETANKEEGKRLYQQYCVSCHSPKGEGAGDMIPGLSQTEWVTGDPSKLIRVMLEGLSGPIEVKGQMYDQEMPAFHMLTDTQIASILTYIRQDFGNDAGKISTSMVAEERKEME